MQSKHQTVAAVPVFLQNIGLTKTAGITFRNCECNADLRAARSNINARNFSEGKKENEKYGGNVFLFSFFILFFSTFRYFKIYEQMVCFASRSPSTFESSLGIAKMYMMQRWRARGVSEYRFSNGTHWIFPFRVSHVVPLPSRVSHHVRTNSGRHQFLPHFTRLQKSDNNSTK